MEKDPNKMIKDLQGITSEEIEFLPKQNLRENKLFQSMLVPVKNKVGLYSNLFKINLNKSFIYYLYAISFTPEIDNRNIKAKLSLIKDADEQIKGILLDYLHTGDMIFSKVDHTENIIQANVTDKVTKIEYTIILKKTNEVINVNDKSAQISSSSKILLELIIKQILKANPYLDFYKNLFVKKNEKQVIPGKNFQVDFFPGYTTSIVNTDFGLYLNVQIKNKILSNVTCLELIKHKSVKGISQAENNQQIKDFFIRRSIRATYAKRNYRIDDISFDRNPANTTFNWKGKTITIYNYYEVAHKIKIKDKTQPLFVQKSLDKDNKPDFIYLIPELCLLSGIDDDMIQDRDFMKNLATYTKFSPSERVEKTSDIYKLMNEKKQIEIKDPTGKIQNKLPSSLAIKNQNGIEFEPESDNKFNPSYLNVPNIIIDQKKPVKLDNKSRYKVLKPKDMLNWIFVYHQKNFDDANLLFESMLKSCDAVGVKVAEPEWIEVSSNKAQDWIKEVANNNPLKTQFVLFLLDRSNENLYNKLKIHSLCSFGYISQVVKTQSLRKNALSVCSNILKQINIKLGGASYAVDYEKSVKDQNLMIVGVDSSHIQGKRTGVALTASTDKAFLNYYNKIDIIEEKNKEQLIFSVRTFLEEALQNYFKINSQEKKKLPSAIIIYRQGVSLQQKEFLKLELEEIQNYLDGVGKNNLLKDNPIPFYYVIVNTKTNFKFFESYHNKNIVDYANPQQGFIIYDQITNPKFFEFYLQPQFVTAGTATPSLFHVACGNLNKPEMIIKLTYDLCFSYPNWTGPIRVPGPIKLAEKLSKMTAKYTLQEINGLLRNSLSFI